MSIVCSPRWKLIGVAGLFLFSPCVVAQKAKPAKFKVALSGRADFHTIQEAVDHAPATGAIIRIAPGTYHEKISIRSAHVILVGAGDRPADTIITWGDSAKNTGSTFKSGTITVFGAGFEAENLSIANTWWDDHPSQADRSQAVALQLEGDKAVLDRVRIVSGQDTLFANSGACHGDLSSPCAADRQFFHDCFVEGHVDYIFGEAKAVFDHCELHSRRHGNVMITAQSRHSPLEDSGFYMLHCSITGANDGSKVVLGRPWRDNATVYFYDTDVEQDIDPAGWSEWGDRLATSTYREYKSHGPGANLGNRIVKSPDLELGEEAKFSTARLLAGEDAWNPEREVKVLRTLAGSR